MCGIWKVVHYLNGPVVCDLQLIHLPASKTPQLQPSEVVVVNSIELELALWVCEVKLSTD